jgi:chromosome partitioning protein
MATIAFVSQKGGVGKSALARSLAVEASRAGISVKIADLDTQQKTAVDWNGRRLEAGIEPVVEVQMFGTAAQAIQAASDFDLLIIDGPARFSKATAEIAKAADLVVQPTGGTLDDMLPGVREFHALLKAGVPAKRLAFALTKVPSDVIEREAREYLEAAGYAVLGGSLLFKAAYGKALDVGRAVTETSYVTLNDQALTLINALVARIGEETDAPAAEANRRRPKPQKTPKKPPRRAAVG